MSKKLFFLGVMVALINGSSTSLSGSVMLLRSSFGGRGLIGGSSTSLSGSVTLLGSSFGERSLIGGSSMSLSGSVTLLGSFCGGLVVGTLYFLE